MSPAVWSERMHGEVNYYHIQFLTGHGYFARTFAGWVVLVTRHALYDDSAIDDPHYTLFDLRDWSLSVRSAV